VLFIDLLRVTVLLIAAVSSVLGTVTVIAANQSGQYSILAFAGAWWVAAALIGIALGRSRNAAEAMSRVLAGARTATSLPEEAPGRIALQRLWPIGVFAVVAGGVAWLWPQVAAVGTGYAILTALSWRNRERAVVAIEERDGVRFYVDPTSAFSPVRLIRTPGLGRDRMPPGHPPPPPPAT
jgi:hypothetical protein